MTFKKKFFLGPGKSQHTGPVCRGVRLINLSLIVDQRAFGGVTSVLSIILRVGRPKKENLTQPNGIFMPNADCSLHLLSPVMTRSHPIIWAILHLTLPWVCHAPYWACVLVILNASCWVVNNFLYDKIPWSCAESRLYPFKRCLLFFYSWALSICMRSQNGVEIQCTPLFCTWMSKCIDKRSFYCLLFSSDDYVPWLNACDAN